MNARLLKQPSGSAPVVMSMLALCLVWGYYAMHGNLQDGVRPDDEGAAAHLWQLLMAGQVPIIGWFALKWLPRQTRDAMTVLAIQAAAALASFASLYVLEAR